MAEPNTSIFPIRTFADDIKRAQGETPLPHDSTPEIPRISPLKQEPRRSFSENLPPQPQPKERPPEQSAPTTPKAETPPPQHTHTEIKRVAPPLARTQTLAPPKASDTNTFDIRNESDIQHSMGDATILTEHRARKPWLVPLIAKLRSLFFTEDTQQAEISELPPQKPVPEPSFIPASERPAPDVAPPERPHLTEKPSTQPEWKRVSEPKKDESTRTSYAEALHASLPEQTTPKQSLKTARLVRPDTELTPEEKQVREAHAYERLGALSAEHNSVQVPVEEVPRSRDIPFIPPELSPQEQATPLRTYRNDALETVQTDSLSAPRLAALERTRSERRGDVFVPSYTTKRSSRLIPILASLVLVLALSGGSIVAYRLITNRSTTQAPVVQGPQRPFIPDITVTVPLPETRTALLQALNDTKTRTPLSNETLEITLTDAGGGPVPEGRIYTLFDLKAPGPFVRTLQPPFMIGAHGPNKTPFMIVGIRDFEAGLSGALSWEAFMSVDLAPYFGEPVRRTFDPLARNADQTREAFFVDEVIQNRDVRILRNELGVERILYTFINEKTLLVAGSRETLLHIMRMVR